MDQIKSIVREVYSGVVASPDKIADLVTRTQREYVVLDFAKNSSMILALEGGGEDDQYDYSGLPNSHQLYVSFLNKRGKTVVGMLIASRETQGARIQQIWTSTPAVGVVLFALGLRIWGAYLDAHPAFTSTVSMLKKYGDVNGSTTQDELTVYSCASAVSALSYQDDVKTVTESDEGVFGDLLRSANDTYREGSESVMRGVKIWYDIFPSGGGDVRGALRKLKHPAVYLIDEREEILKKTRGVSRP